MIEIRKNKEIYKTIDNLSECMSYNEIAIFCNKNINEDKFYIIKNNNKIIYTDLYLDYSINTDDKIILDNVELSLLQYDKNDIYNVKKYIDIESCRKSNINKELLEIAYTNVLTIIERYINDTFFTLMLVNTYGNYYLNINNNLKYNFYIIRCALGCAYENLYNCIDIFNHIPDEIKSHTDFFNGCIVKINFIEYASDSLKNNKDFMLNAITINPFKYYNVSKNLLDNEEIIICTLNSFVNKEYKNAVILKYASINIRDNKSIVMLILKEYGLELSYVSNRLKNDKEVIMAAVSQNGYAIGFIKNGYNDQEILIKALYNEHIINYSNCNVYDEKFLLSKIPKILCNNKEIILGAVYINGYNFKYASNFLKNNKKFLIEVIKNSFIMPIGTTRFYINKNIINIIKISNMILKNMNNKDIHLNILKKLENSYKILNNEYEHTYIYKTKNILKDIIFIYRNKIKIKKSIKKIKICNQYLKILNNITF